MIVCVPLRLDFSYELSIELVVRCVQLDTVVLSAGSGIYHCSDQILRTSCLRSVAAERRIKAREVLILE